MTIFVLAMIAIVALVAAIGYYLSGPGYSGAKSAHFDGRTFRNISGKKAKGLGEVLKWVINRKPGNWNADHTASPYEKPPAKVTDGIRITFINHSTFLIQTDGLNILTDPIWSERASPFSAIGPRRMRRPGIDIHDLPGIDLILLTHNHYDHLDIKVLKKLWAGHQPGIIVPLGVDRFLLKENIPGPIPLDWWTSTSVTESMRIEAVPAQHFSGRGMFDRDKTLWCGYVIHRPGGKIYFVGDTGYDEDTFREIARRTGPYKVAMIPIGAYKPEWFMSPIHVSPLEAAKLHGILNPEVSVGMHFGTFPLADDGEDDPVNDLQKGKEIYGISNESFITLKQGGFLRLK